MGISEDILTLEKSCFRTDLISDLTNEPDEDFQQQQNNHLVTKIRLKTKCDITESGGKVTMGGVTIHVVSRKNIFSLGSISVICDLFAGLTK